jgi:hypothetical protein
MDKHHEVFITVMYKIPKGTRFAKKINRTNTFEIADKRACKRSSSQDKNARMYRNRKYDRDYKYAE